MRIARRKALHRHGRMLLVACLIAGLNAPGTSTAGDVGAAHPTTQPASPLLVPGTVYTRGGINRPALVRKHLQDAEALIGEASYAPQSHHKQVRRQAAGQLYYTRALKYGGRTAATDREWADVEPWPEVVNPGQPAGTATPTRRDAGRVEEDKTGTYVLLGIGALMLANELLRDQEPTVTTANQKPRPKRTFPCPDCTGTGEATMEGHRVFDNVPGPSMSFGPCLRCDGIGKLPPLW